jgi:hypothetical protein
MNEFNFGLNINFQLLNFFSIYMKHDPLHTAKHEVF